MIKRRMSDKPGWKTLQVGLEKLKTGMKPRRKGEMSEGKTPKPSFFGGKLRRACEAFGSRLLFGKCLFGCCVLFRLAAVLSDHFNVVCDCIIVAM